MSKISTTDKYNISKKEMQKSHYFFQNEKDQTVNIVDDPN